MNGGRSRASEWADSAEAHIDDVVLASFNLKRLAEVLAPSSQ